MQSITYIEGPEPCQEVKPTQDLSIDGLSVGGLFQLVIQMNAQVLIGPNVPHVTPTNADWRR